MVWHFAAIEFISVWEFMSSNPNAYVPKVSSSAGLLLTPQSWDHLESELSAGFKGASPSHVLVQLSYAEFTDEASEVVKTGY